MQIPCLLIYFVFEAAPDRYCSTPGAMAMSSLDPYMQGGAASRGVGALGDFDGGRRVSELDPREDRIARVASAGGDARGEIRALGLVSG